MNTSEPISAQTRAKRTMSFGILMLIGVFGLTNSFQSVVMNRVVDTYQLTGGAQGIMSSMINLGSILAFFAAPMLQGRIKKTSMLIAACLLLAASFFLLGGTQVFAAMIAASILAGLGFGWLDTNCNAVMVDLHPEDSASYLGLLHGGFGVGSLISPLLITALFAVITWRGVSFVMGAVVAVTAVAFLAILARSKRTTPASAPEQPLTFAATRAFLTKRKNVLMLVSGMLYAITQSGLLIWLVRYMTLQYGAETLGSTALSIYWVCATLSRFFAPRIPMRPLKLFVLGALLSCVFQTVGVLSGSPVVMCVMVGIIGLVTGHCVPMLLSEIARGQQGNSALAASATLVSMCFMRILVPVGMGAIAGAVNISVAMLTPAVSGALAGILALVVLRLEKRETVVAEA
jgi:MFS family permease